MARKMKEYIAKIDTKMEALVLVGNLLAGNITVNVDTDEIIEVTQDEQLFDAEFANMLKAIGVETVPVEILARCGKRTVTKENGEITIDDVTEQINRNTANGLLHDLLTGTTHVDVTTGFMYWCYGGNDGAEHKYATIKGCVGMYIDAYDVCETYVDSWYGADFKDKEAVEKLIKLIRG